MEDRAQEQPGAEPGAARTPPHVVMMVANRVTGDSRVQKSAQTAVAAGYRVTVLGLARRASVGPAQVGGVDVVRLPLPAPLTVWGARDLDLTHLDQRDDLRRRAAEQRAVVRHLRMGRRRPWPFHVRVVGALDRARQRVRPASRLLRAGWSAHRRWTGWVRRQLARRWWRLGYPYFADLEAEMAQAAIALRPDLVHAHDVHVVAAARLASRVLAERGRPCVWVYDAHEWIPGVPAQENPARARASRVVEREAIRAASAVVTVSPGLAALLTERYALRRPVTVVANAPSSVVLGPPQGRGTLREETGVGPDVPLLVYAGGLHPRRGLATVVAALPALAGVHLALVAEQHVDYRRAVTEQAARLGVADRVHLAAYVPPENITWYLAGADVGLVPIWRTPSHDSACPTKVGEYLHAGLPVVTSSTTATAELVTRTGVGEVFPDRDVDGLVAAVRAVLGDVERYRRAITADLLSEMSWERSGEALLSVYADLLAVGSPTTAVR